MYEDGEIFLNMKDLVQEDKRKSMIRMVQIDIALIVVTVGYFLISKLL